MKTERDAMAEDQTVKLPNGDLYVGQIAGGKPDGSGAFLDSNLPDCACLYASDRERSQGFLQYCQRADY